MLAASSVPAVSAAEMAEVDELAVGRFGITLLQMMELAARGLAEVVRTQVGGDLRERRILVVSGTGDNGAGGIAGARHLAARGSRVRVVLASPVRRLSDAGRHHLATLLAMGVSARVAAYDVGEDELDAEIDDAEVVVDAILGYRARGAPEGDAARLVHHVTRARAPVVSLDLPTGIDPDTGLAATDAVSAQATVTLALPKRGLLTPTGAIAAGRLFLADLGLPPALYAALGLEVGPLFATGPLVELDAMR